MATEKIVKLKHQSFIPCRDFIFAMLPLIGMATYLYGLRVIIQVAVAILTALVLDLADSLLRRVKLDTSDLSSYMFAMIFTIMLPASINYSTVFFGTLVVVLSKHVFGGYGCYPYNPAAFGFAFMTLCVGEKMFLYPKAFSPIGIGFDSGAQLFAGVSNTLKLGGVPNIDTIDLLLGKYTGPIGTTFCLIILSCLVLLIARGTISWHVPFSYLATCAAWAYLFPRISTGRIESVMYEMLTGAVVFCAVFICPTPSLVPRGRRARLAYGVTLGIATMFFRSVGVYEMGVCFATLLINPLVPYFDRVFAPKSAIIKGGNNRL